MLKYDNTVSSTVDGKPIYGAQVNVYDPSRALASIYADAMGTTPASQPILTDQLGYFSFYIPDGLYEVRVQTGVIEISRTNITMVDTLGLKERALLVPMNEDGGTLPAAGQRLGMVLAFDQTTGAPTALLPNSFAGTPGATGPANSTYTTLAALKAAPSTNASYILTTPTGPITYAYVTGDFTGKADDVNVVALNATPLTTGALVRQSIASTTFKQDGSQVALDGQTKARQYRTAKDFGATGILAQNDQPLVQAHFDVEGPYAGNRGGTATLPKGRYRLGASILLKSYSEFRGEGARTSILDQEDAPVTYPAFKWDYVGVQYGFASTSDVGVRGFSHGVLITQDTDEVSLRRMHLYACSVAGVQVNGMLQTGVFEELKIESCNNGIVSNSTICNAMTFRKCDTKNISGEHIHINGAEGTNVEDHRFEGGGLVGGYTLNLANVKQMTFGGGASYMESTHEYAARIVNCTGVITFRGMHFTGTGARSEGTPGPYKWLTDGTGRLIFENCDSFYTMRVPAHAEIKGACPGILRSQYRGDDRRTPRTVTGSSNFALIRFTRLTAVADNGNVSTLSGTLRLVVSYVAANGDYTRLDRSIKISVVGRGASLVINAVTKDTDDAGTAVSTTNLSSSIDAGNLSGLLTINLSPLVIGSPVFTWSGDITWEQTAAIDQNTFAVELQ